MLDCQARGLSQATLTMYLGVCERFIGAVGDLALADLSAAHVRAFLAQQAAAGRANSYLITQLRCLRIWCSFLVDKGLIDASPTARVRPPRHVKKVLPPYTPAEMKVILQAARAGRDRAMLHFLADTGVRAAELCALNVGDVDLVARAATVRSGKGGKTRTVRYGYTTAKLVRIYLAQRGRPGDGAPLWAGQGGRRLRYRGLQSLLRRYGQALGVELQPHKFRRTYCVTMLRNGCDLYTLALLMGHASIRQLEPYLALAAADTERAQAEFGVVDNL